LPTNLRVDVELGGTAELGVDYTVDLDEFDGGYFLSIPAGETSKTFTFTSIDNDEREEENKTATFTFSTSDESITLPTESITVTIENDDTFSDVELFLQNSAKTSKIYSPFFCGFDFVFDIDYDSDQYPTSITISSLYDDFDKVDGPGVETINVSFNEDSIWFTYDISAEFRAGGKEEEIVMVVEVGSDLNISRVKFPRFIRGRRSPFSLAANREDGPGYGSQVVEFTYDNQDRLTKADYFFEGEEAAVATMDVAYSGNTATITSEEFFVNRNDGEGPNDILYVIELDDKNTPYQGFPALSWLLFGSAEAVLFFSPTLMPHNVAQNDPVLLRDLFLFIRGEGIPVGGSTQLTDISMDYTYDASGNYPISAEAVFTYETSGVEEVPPFTLNRQNGVPPGPVTYTETFIRSWHYLDRENGPEPQISEDCFSPER
jgi:hypothetical protein